MKLRALIITFFLATVALHAEFKVDTVLANAKSDPKNAPAIVAFAAVDNPKFLLPLLSAAVDAFPDQAVEIVQALLKANPAQLLWGTDWPHPAVQVMPNDGDLVGLVPIWLPTEELRVQVLVRNPARLYGFD